MKERKQSKKNILQSETLFKIRLIIIFSIKIFNEYIFEILLLILILSKTKMVLLSD